VCWDCCSQAAASRWWRDTSRHTPGPRSSDPTSACTAHSSCRSQKQCMSEAKRLA